MNAYELANEMEAYEDAGMFMQKASIMLRQQADRIERLEAEAKSKNNYLEQHCQKIDQQADRIAELQAEVDTRTWVRKLLTEPKPLNDDEIPVLGILHRAESVPLGSPIWETDAEYEKLKKIVITTVRVMEKRYGVL